MSGAGHMMDMNRRMRDMRAERQSKRRSKSERNKIKVSRVYSNVNYKKATPEQMAAIQLKIEKIKKQERLMKLVFGVSVVLIFLIIGIWRNSKPQATKPIPATEIIGPDHPIRSYLNDPRSKDLIKDSSLAL